MEGEEYVMTIADYNRKEQMLERQINNAMMIITQYGSIDGSHHKQWCLDQIARCLLSGNGYAEWLKEMNKDDEYDYWDEGIAP